MPCNYMSHNYHETTVCFSARVAEYPSQTLNQHWKIDESCDESILQLANAVLI